MFWWQTSAIGYVNKSVVKNHKSGTGALKQTNPFKTPHKIYFCGGPVFMVGPDFYGESSHGDDLNLYD